MPQTAPPAATNGLSASPVARRLARALGLELAGLTGTGPHARILKTDVRGAATASPPAPVATTPSPPAAATFDLAVEVDMEAALALTAGLEIAVEHLVVKALAGVREPVAVAGDDGVRGVPDAARRSLSSIARGGTTEPADDAIAVAAAPGADRYVPALPAGVTAVIAAAAVRPRPVGRGGDLVLAPTAHLTLRCDAAKMSPDDGVRLLDAVRTRLETPLTLAL